jgi:dTDP-4-amino-4,6-dideoxygalactose transaminase
MAEKLALFGGNKTISREFPVYNSLGVEECEAATEVVKSGKLSGFLGSWHPDFYGGEKVKAFERAWADYFKVKHAVTVNSATSGLVIAVGAAGIEPGDEVITSPWTMCATSTAILWWNAVPVFADIDPETCNLDPKSVEKNITPLTRAIMIPDIMGHPADMDEIMRIARAHKLKVIEDTAQAPSALYRGRFAGTLSDIGVFSLNYHKHIHTGEGGVCVTDDDSLFEKMLLIRNHAEAVVADKGAEDYVNMIGFNFRLGEIEAAIGIEQLKKLKRLTDSKTRAGARLSEGLRGLGGLKTPAVRKDCTHVYYVYAMILDLESVGVPRKNIAEALRAEGVSGLMEGFATLHLLPVYQKKIAYGRKGFPWQPPVYAGNVSYAKGICPVAEDYDDSRMLGLQLCKHFYTDDEVDLVIKAFRKVWDNLPALKEIP